MTFCFHLPFLDSRPLDPRLVQGVVGLTGLEPVTLRLSSACSNQLSYRPVAGLARFVGASQRYAEWRLAQKLICTLEPSLRLDCEQTNVAP